MLSSGVSLMAAAHACYPSGRPRHVRRLQHRRRPERLPAWQRLPHGAGGGSGAAADDHLLHVLAGTVNRSLVPALHRAVHRITRGNSVVHDAPIDEPLLGFAQVSPLTPPLPLPPHSSLRPHRHSLDRRYFLVHPPLPPPAHPTPPSLRSPKICAGRQRT